MLTSKCTIAVMLLAALGLISLTVPGQAQMGMEGMEPDLLRPGVVSGTGSEVVKQPPTLLRMTVQLTGKGKTVAEALTQLKDRREAAVMQLDSLGATKDSLNLTDPELSAGVSPRQQQMERSLLQQWRSQGRRVPKALQIPRSVVVSSTLTAEWPLQELTPEELLPFAKDLEDKIQEADLGGLNEPQELSAEEQELAEEMAERTSDYGYDEEQAKPGEPQFFYLARISDQQRDQALAAAFGRAKLQAEILARAAGVKLGKLASLHASAMPASNEDFPDEAYAYRMRQLLSRRQSLSGVEANDLEAVAPRPGQVSVNITVAATFHLE